LLREAPAWFNDELERVGGTNRYGEPLFKLVWSEVPRMIVGGKFADGFVGYRSVKAVPGVPCWALMIWESPETFGHPDDWNYQYRDIETGLLDMGSFPKEGRYRLLKQLMHRDIQRQEKSEVVWNPFMKKPEMRRIQDQHVVTYKMEPCGLILDLMVPMLAAWRRLTFDQKLEAVMDRKARQDAERERAIKDAWAGSRVRRGSQLVQKRAEFIEKGMDSAMKIASQYGRGMMSVA
jgi:hypothetical protein